jgi:hypothetical protein
MATPAWKFYLWRPSTATAPTGTIELTSYVKIQEVTISVAGNSSGTNFSLPLIGFNAASSVDRGRVPRLDDIIYVTRLSDSENPSSAVIKAVGVVTAIDRDDNYGIAGVSPRYTVTVADGTARLKERIFKQYNAAEVRDKTNVGARAQEWPKWYSVDKKAATAYGKKYAKTPQQMIEWVIGNINRSENGQVAPKIAGVVTPVPQLTMPVVDKDAPSGYSTKLMVFDHNYPQVINGLRYFDVIDSTCKWAGLNWTLEPYLAPSGEPQVKIRTWPAYWLDSEDDIASYRAAIEISDSPDVLPIKTGATVVPAQTLTGAEDVSSLINYVVYSWEPVDAQNRPTGAKVAIEQDAASQALYGRHDERVATSNLTQVAAQAEALKLIRQHKRPDFRGSATIRYNATFKPGCYVYLHRTKHANTGATPYWTRLSQSLSINYSFSDGGDDPTWMSIEFGDSTYPAKPKGFIQKDTRSAKQKAQPADNSTGANETTTLPPVRVWAQDERPSSASQKPGRFEFAPDVEIPQLGTPHLVMLDTVPMRRQWSTTPPNVALNGNGTASASSSTTNGPTRAFDGDPLTYWSASSTAVNAWVEFDFGAATSIKGVAVDQDDNGGGASTYSLQSSTDGTTWTDRQTGIVGDLAFSTFTPVSARYWRIYRTAQAGTATGWKVFRFELFADAEEIEIGSLNNRHRGAIVNSSGVISHAEKWEAANPYGETYWIGNPVAQFRDTVYDSASGLTYNASSTPVIVGFGASGWTSGYKDRVKSVRVFLSLTNRHMDGAGRQASRVRIRQLSSLPAINKGTTEYTAWAAGTGGSTPIARAHWRAVTGGDDWMRAAPGLVQEFQLDNAEATTRIALDVVPRLYTVPNQKDDTTTTVMGVFLAIQPCETVSAPTVPASPDDVSNYAELIVGSDYNLQKSFTISGAASVGFGTTGGNFSPYPLEYLGKKIFSLAAPALLDANRLQKPMTLDYDYPERATLSSVNYDLMFDLNAGPDSLTDQDCYALAQIDSTARLFGDAQTFQHKLSQEYPGQTVWNFKNDSGYTANRNKEINVYIEGSPVRKDVAGLCTFIAQPFDQVTGVSPNPNYHSIDISRVRPGGLRAGEQLVLVYSPAIGTDVFPV